MAEICHQNRNTMNRYLKLTRSVIADFYEQELPFAGKVELDKPYFGLRYKKGERGRGAVDNKHIVFGVYKRNGKVFRNRRKREI